MSVPAEAVVVDSVTGVEVSLPVAGPGARAYAFTIDWHIRAILAVAWFVMGMMIYNDSFTSLTPPLETDGLWFGLIALPAGAIYFLYHPALEIAMRGRTPGKRMVRLRIVTRAGGTPSLGAHLIRNVFRLVDTFPVFYGLGLIMTLITRNHVRIGDLAAGTLLVHERDDATLLAAPAPGSTLDAHTAELVGELLKRWTELTGDARQKLAARLLPPPPAGEGGVGAHVDDAALRAQLENLLRGARA
jgi:uncharacterized RDD family membrane protein YckC